MIAAYNTFAPYAGDFFLVLWLLTIAPLCWLIVRHHDKEAATVFGYTAGLELAAWSVSIWYDPAVLLVVHVILFTLLFSAHFFYCTMEGAYGDHIMTLAALMGFVDLFSLAGKWHAAVHLSIINILFGVICYCVCGIQSR